MVSKNAGATSSKPQVYVEEIKQPAGASSTNGFAQVSGMALTVDGSKIAKRYDSAMPQQLLEAQDT